MKKESDKSQHASKTNVSAWLSSKCISVSSYGWITYGYSGGSLGIGISMFYTWLIGYALMSCSYMAAAIYWAFILAFSAMTP